MLGILRERLGLKLSTLQAFKNAYEKSFDKHRDLARVNYGRSLYKMGYCSKAINIFEEVQEATFSSGSTLALALFKGGLLRLLLNHQNIVHTIACMAVEWNF